MKRLILPLLLLMLCFSGWSQNRKENQERIKAQKVAFITERLDLSPKEAQEFWPVYNAFEDKVNSMRRNDLKEVREAMKRGNLSKDEAQKILNQFMAVEDKMHAAKKQLVSDLADILPPQKIIQLKVSEDEFNRRLMKMLEERRNKMQENRKNRN